MGSVESAGISRIPQRHKYSTHIKRRCSMSNIKNAIKTTEDSGTTIAKESLITAVKKSADKSFPFAKDMNGKYAVVRIPLC